MMKANAHKYSVSAMCCVLQVNRSTYYYEAKQRPNETGRSTEITEIFKTSRNNYGTRKIKAEATFKIIKTEFVWNETFADLSELKRKLWNYVHWYNHHRIHSTLGYETPVQYREHNLKKVI